jgi:lipoate-protein ligase A
MSADAALLDRVGEEEIFVRLYCWSGPWITLGRFQRPERALVDQHSVPFVRRPTGGKAVVHGHDATVAIAVGLRRLGTTARDIRTIYRSLVSPLARALTDAGLPAILAESTPFSRVGDEGSGDCFAFRSPNDVVDPVSGAKVCGCALRVSGRAALLQASIPVHPPLIQPERVLRGALPMPIPPKWNPERLPDALQERLQLDWPATNSLPEDALIEG